MDQPQEDEDSKEKREDVQNEGPSVHGGDDNQNNSGSRTSSPDPCYEHYPTRKDPDVTIEQLVEMVDDSLSRRAWIERRHDGTESNSIDEFMLKVGLEDAKSHFVRIYDRYHPAGRQSQSADEVPLDLFITGNRGVGKSVVAEIYGSLLRELDIVPNEDTPLRIKGSTLNSDNQLQRHVKRLDDIEYNGGGFVVEVEEAQDILNLHPVMKTLLTKAHSGSSTIVLIIFGHLHEIQGLSHGLTAELPTPYTLKLPDYTDEDLCHILISRIKKHCKKRCKQEDKEYVEGGFDGPYLRDFIKIISRSRKASKFENAKTLKDRYKYLKERRRGRLVTTVEVPSSQPFFTQANLLGETLGEFAERSESYTELRDMVGLKQVKEAVDKLVSHVMVNHNIKLQRRRPLDVTVNRCFLGPPGNGKTTAAKLFAKILWDLDLINSSGFLTRPASNFIGAYVGHSEEKTKRYSDYSDREVLVIDDFQLLYKGGDIRGSDSFRKAVVDTLVANFQPKPGDGRAVILIGYPEPMHALFEASNPELARRFPLDQAFNFAPFDEGELMEILQFNLQKHELSASREALSAAKKVVSIARHRPSFGNAGDVEHLLNQAKSRLLARVVSSSFDSDMEFELKPEDFDPDYDRAMRAKERCDDLFGGMEGMEHIVSLFHGWQTMVLGPPGTGKTTVARKVGKLFYDMGLLLAPGVIECSASELISPYVGASGPKLIRMFEHALGKVLFIDEAYRLGEIRAVDTIGEIVDCMTKERFHRKLVVILAGYQEDTDRLIRLNRGLRSRFPTHITFHPMPPIDSLTLLGKLVEKLGIKLDALRPSDPLHGTILNTFDQLARRSSWANGRDVESLSHKVIEYVYIHKTSEVNLDTKETIRVHAGELLGILLKRLKRTRSEDAEMEGRSVRGRYSDRGSTYRDERTDTDEPWFDGIERVEHTETIGV